MWPFTSSPAPQAAPQAAPHPLPTDGGGDKCPVDHTTRQAWLQSNSSAPHPFHPETAAQSSSKGLSHDREISSIPRSSNSTPNIESQPVPGPSKHTPPPPATQGDHGSGRAAEKDADGNWVYPSEQQFFNAMMRKNHNPRAEDMRTIVPIHNAVNEKAWEQILWWEAVMGSERCGGPRLSSFTGRPRDRSPKAYAMGLLGYAAPFDRHDWIVDRCGTQVRYVIDFYTGKSDPSNPRAMAFHLDARPALDNWDGVKTRIAGWWR